MEDLREVVKKYLAVNDLTWAFCARKVGIAPSTLHEWLNHKTNLSHEVTIRMKEFLKGEFLVPIEYILTGDTNVVQ